MRHLTSRKRSDTVKTVRRQSRPQLPGDRSQAKRQKEVITSNEVLWWRAPDADLPSLPHPRDKVPDARLPAAKKLAVVAVQEWGVWVEASRASRMGRWQLEYQARTDPDFKADLLKARRECFERIEREMMKRAQHKGGDLAAIFTMKNNLRRYREINRVELTGKDGGPLAYTDAAKAEILRRLDLLATRRGLEGKAEIVVGSGGSAGSGVSGSAGSRPQLVKGSEGPKVRKVSK